MTPARFIAVLTGGALAFGLGLPTAPAEPGKPAAAEPLLPATLQVQTDDKGNQWSLNNYGFLQNTGNSFFNNVLMLHVNGQQFYNYQPMVTTDGKEFVLPSQQPLSGLQVTRRIRLLEKDGVMRYVDIFQNSGASPITATVEYRNNFSQPLKATVSERGSLNPPSLGKGETGVVITSKQNGQKGCVLVLCGPQGRLKPSFSQRGQYESHFSFSLTVPAGQKVALGYMVGVCPPSAENDTAALARIFKGVPAAKALKSIRREELAILANFATGAGGEPGALLATNGLDSLEVERGKSDVLAMGEKTRLTGTASCGEFAIAATYGAAPLPFERVAAVVGGARAGGATRVFLRDGQVLSGSVTAMDFQFAMPSGARVDLDLATLDRLVCRVAPTDGRWDPETAAMLLTHQGDVVALTGEAAAFEATTSWGPLRFSLDDVLWFGPSEEAGVGHQIEFTDGSRFFGFLAGPPIAARTRLFGAQSIAPGDIRGLVTAAAVVRTGEKTPAPAADQPNLVLSGGQRLLGQVEAATLTVLTGAKAVSIPPSGIRSMRNVRDEVDADPLESPSPPFQIELWGGGILLGPLREPVITVRVHDAVWSVPTADIVELHTPSPRVSDEVRLQLAGLIRDLGSDDWEKREAASGTLAEFGSMARPMLDEALKSSPDPEVRRRVEKLIADLE